MAAASKKVDIFGTFLSGPSSDSLSSMPFGISEGDAQRALEAMQGALAKQAIGNLSDADIEKALLSQLAQAEGGNPAPLGDLAAKLPVRPTQVAMVLGQLVDAHLVERIDNANEALFALTPLGRSLTSTQL